MELPDSRHPAIARLPDAETLPPMRRWALAEVRRIVLAGLAGRPARVWLIGSHARGTWRHHSDIDVAIDPAEPLPPGLHSDIVQALEESAIPYFVDVIDLARSPDMADRVREQGIEWTNAPPNG